MRSLITKTTNRTDRNTSHFGIQSRMKGSMFDKDGRLLKQLTTTAASNSNMTLLKWIGGKNVADLIFYFFYKTNKI
jgi:hypothetical protein